MKLKLIDLLSYHRLIAVLFILPLLLGLISGVANLANHEMSISLAIVDNDKTLASRELSGKIGGDKWDIRITGEKEAHRLLYGNQIDGIIIINEGYAENLAELDAPVITFDQAENSLVTTIVRETATSAILPDHARITLLDKIISRYSELSRPVPEKLEERFLARISYYSGHDARLIINYIGRENIVPVITYVITDYSLQVFFLSIYAFMSVLLLARSDMRRRLATTGKGLLLDYIASIASILILGIIQITLFTFPMNFLMKTKTRPQEILYLAIFLFLLVGLGQLLQLVSTNLRLTLAMLLLIISATAGGSFFSLPETLLRKVGQYTPHGWVLSSISGYSALPFYWPFGLAVLLITAGYFLQIKMARLDAAAE